MYPWRVRAPNPEAERWKPVKLLEKVSAGVARLRPYEPGRPIEDVARAFGLDPDHIIKLASNESALGPSPVAMQALREALPGMHRYPDGGANVLRDKLAARFGVGPEQVLVGNGSNEVLELVGHAFLGPDRGALFSAHAFAVYKLVSTLFDAPFTEVATTTALEHDLDAMAAAITPETAVVFVCNPNNPTSTMVSPQAVDAFMHRIPEDVLVVFDEAYAEIAMGPMPDTLRYVHEGRPVLVTRTFPKAYGLAGLRLGYGIGPAPLVQALQQARQPFNCNLAAQVAGAAALDDDAFLTQSRALYKAGKELLEAEFAAMDLPYIPAHANFMLVRVGHGSEVSDALQQRGVIVRPMAGYGLPEYVRVTFGTDTENQRLVHTLREVLAR